MFAEFSNGAGVSKNTIIAAVLVLTASGSFGLGRLSSVDEIRVPLTVTASTASVASASSVKEESSAIVASKNGTKYYLPSCSGAKSIKEENKVWFESAAEARALGYEPAANCKGL